MGTITQQRDGTLLYRFSGAKAGKHDILGASIYHSFDFEQACAEAIAVATREDKTVLFSAEHTPIYNPTFISESLRYPYEGFFLIDPHGKTTVKDITRAFYVACLMHEDAVHARFAQNPVCSEQYVRYGTLDQMTGRAIAVEQHRHALLGLLPQVLATQDERLALDWFGVFARNTAADGDDDKIAAELFRKSGYGEHGAQNVYEALTARYGRGVILGLLAEIDIGACIRDPGARMLDAFGEPDESLWAAKLGAFKTTLLIGHHTRPFAPYTP